MTRKRAGAPSAVRWPKCGAKLAEVLPRPRLHPSVTAWADGSKKKATWFVGFSGGADSLALLLLVWAHWPEHRGRLRALHFDHRLRGAESTRDRLFCRKVCRSLGVPLIDEAWRDAPSDPSEAEARLARHAFFNRHAKLLWLGHQQDDIAETFFMRLARGSGTGGLAAPRPIAATSDQRVKLRPLLTLKKTEIISALKAIGAVWCEDSTNTGDAYFRNRVRRQVLPTWQKAAQRDALAGAARSRELLEEDDAALEAWVDFVKPIDARGALNLVRLRRLPRGLVRRALHRWMAGQKGVRVSRQAFDAILDDVMRGRITRHSLGHNGFAELTSRRLQFASARKNTR